MLFELTPAGFAVPASPRLDATAYSPALPRASASPVAA